MKFKKNYILFTSATITLVVFLLSIVSIIAPFEFRGTTLKQTNIYSSVVSDSMIRELFGLEYINLNDTIAYQNNTILQSPTNTKDSATIEKRPKIIVKEIAKPKNSTTKERSTHIAIAEQLNIPPAMLEDYSKEQNYTQKLKKGLLHDTTSSFRIAYIGDSFVEGDILTMDLREILQEEFSGGGVGYLPITSPSAKYRASVLHKYSKNWTTNCITSKRQNNKYTIAGYEFIPKDGSWVEYKRSKFRKHSQNLNTATLLFICKDSCEISVELNNKLLKTYTPKPSPELQSIVIDQPIETIKYTFNSCKGVIVYGAIIDDNRKEANKIQLDNYSIRGNSGVSMDNIDYNLATQYNKFAPYSLIMVQYGLNVSGQKNYSYAKYGNQLLEVIEKLKKCYPKSIIALIGVSDRCTMVNGTPVTMPSIVTLDNIQRQVAQSSGIIYWSSLQAMQNMGGMGKFVENKWATKDYTHINTLGGKKMAERLYAAIENQIK